MRERRTQIVGWLLVVLSAAAFGLIASHVTAQYGGAENVDLENTTPGILGEDCPVPGDTRLIFEAQSEYGQLMRCDPADKKWRLMPLMVDRLSIRLSGTCAGGANSGKYCQIDADCPSSTCTMAGERALVSLYPRGTGSTEHYTLVRFDPSTDANAPYPGMSTIENNSGDREYLVSGPTSTLTQLRIDYPNVTVGDPSKPAPYYGTILTVEGTLALDGSYTGANRTAGYLNGWARIFAEDTGGDLFRFFDGFSSLYAIGRVYNDGSNLCYGWQASSIGISDDFSLCRGAVDQLTISGADPLLLFGGGLEMVSPYMFEGGTRTVVVLSHSAISTSGWQNGTLLRWAGFTEDATTAQGVPMPRDGSIIAYAAWCEFSSGPDHAGRLYGEIQVNDSGVWTTYSDCVADTGPHRWNGTQARGTDAFSAGDWIGVEVGEDAVTKYCDVGTTEECDPCTDNGDCTGGDCTTMDVGDDGDCTFVVEVVFDD